MRKKSIALENHIGFSFVGGIFSYQPVSKMVPESGSSKPAIIRSRVVPQPEGPKIEKLAGVNGKETSFKTRVPENCLKLLYLNQFLSMPAPCLFKLFHKGNQI